MAPAAGPADGRLPVVLDTDANNELDDQHAIAYLLANRQVFRVEGITTNATREGGGIAEHTAEARRVVRMMGAEHEIPVVVGADGDFPQIAPHAADGPFDGQPAVAFLRQRARAASPDRKLVILAIGKLTNVALALRLDPAIAERARVVWLGSNWPRPGEYNLADDPAAAAYVVDSPIQLDIAVVRYDEPTGTAAVTITIDEIRRRMPGKGPRVSPPVPGRHGGAFATFGDYSLSLFQHIGDDARAMFDMATVAAVKQPRWARWTAVPAPRLEGERWIARPDNVRRIRFVTDFDRTAIIEDLFASLRPSH